MKKRKDILIEYKGECIKRNIEIDIGCVRLYEDSFECCSHYAEPDVIMFRDSGKIDRYGNEIWTNN